MTRRQCDGPHRCAACGRMIPKGDPAIERSVLEHAVRTTYVRSIYYCRGHQP